MYSYFKSCCCLNTELLHHHHRMHIENELAEIMTTGDREFEEIVKEYVEEILLQEEVPEPPLTHAVNTTPAQDKPRCITLIFYNHWIYICDMHLRYRNFMKTTYIDITVLWVLLVQVRVAAMLRFSIAWVTCRYTQYVIIIITLMIKMMKQKWRPGRDMA